MLAHFCWRLATWRYRWFSDLAKLLAYAPAMTSISRLTAYFQVKTKTSLCLRYKERARSKKKTKASILAKISAWRLCRGEWYWEAARHNFGIRWVTSRRNVLTFSKWVCNWHKIEWHICCPWHGFHWKSWSVCCDVWSRLCYIVI